MPVCNEKAQFTQYTFACSLCAKIIFISCNTLVILQCLMSPQRCKINFTFQRNFWKQMTLQSLSNNVE